MKSKLFNGDKKMFIHTVKPCWYYLCKRKAGPVLTLQCYKPNITPLGILVIEMDSFFDIEVYIIHVTYGMLSVVIPGP